MAATFSRPTLEGVLDAVADHGIRSVQFGLSSAGLAEMPERIDPDLCAHIRREMSAREITIAALSGTYNMIHPDLHERRRGLAHLAELARSCRRLGASVITLCTGTRDPDYMWRRHPDNDAPQAWDDLVATMKQAVRIAEETGVTLAFEPEVSNVVDSAAKARRLLDQFQSPRLKVLMDGANVFHVGELPRMREVLDEAFSLLGPDIALAHAKDLDRGGEAGHLAAGTGLLDYDHYLSLLRRAGYNGALVLHGLAENQVKTCVEFLRSKLPPG